MDAATDWVVSNGRYALDFDGANDFVDAGDCCDFTTGFLSISAWIRRNETTTAERIIVSKFGRVSAQADEDGYGFRVLNNNLQFFGVLNASTHILSSTTANFNDTNWMHVAVVVKANDGASAAMFRNGYPIGASWTILNGNITLENNPYSFRLANYTYLSTNYGHFSGLIDDVRIYLRQLSPAEIRLLATRRGIAFERRERWSVYVPRTSSLRRKILTGQV